VGLGDKRESVTAGSCQVISLELQSCHVPDSQKARAEGGSYQAEAGEVYKTVPQLQFFLHSHHRQELGS
jgi:hypothetical protein